MRVLHVAPSIAPARGGPSHAIAAMEEALRARGIDITTLTTDDGGPGKRLGAMAPPTGAMGARRVYVRKRLDFYTVAPDALPWLWAHVRDFDIVHIHALFSFMSVAAGLVARRRGAPYIVRPLGGLSAYGVTRRRPRLKRLSLALIDGPLLRHAAAVHFTSEAELREAQALGVPFRPAVIPLGVKAPATGDPGPFLARYPRLRDHRIVLYLSRLDPKKNIEGLLEGFAMARASRANVALVVAGAGSPAYEESLKSLAARLGVADHVLWLGHVDGAFKASTLSAAHVFALTSYSENFGIAAVEAMFAGLPCVLGRGVAIAGEVERAGAGVTTAEDAASIAGALAQLLDDEGLRRDMGERGRRLAGTQYSLSAMADGLIREYRRAAKSCQDFDPSL